MTDTKIKIKIMRFEESVKEIDVYVLMNIFLVVITFKVMRRI